MVLKYRNISKRSHTMSFLVISMFIILLFVYSNYVKSAVVTVPVVATTVFASLLARSVGVRLASSQVAVNSTAYTGTFNGLTAAARAASAGSSGTLVGGVSTWRSILSTLGIVAPTLYDVTTDDGIPYVVEEITDSSTTSMDVLNETYSTNTIPSNNDVHYKVLPKRYVADESSYSTYIVTPEILNGYKYKSNHTNGIDYIYSNNIDSLNDYLKVLAQNIVCQNASDIVYTECNVTYGGVVKITETVDFELKRASFQIDYVYEINDVEDGWTEYWNNTVKTLDYSVNFKSDEDEIYLGNADGLSANIRGAMAESKIDRTIIAELLNELFYDAVELSDYDGVPFTSTNEFTPSDIPSDVTLNDLLTPVDTPEKRLVINSTLFTDADINNEEEKETIIDKIYDVNVVNFGSYNVPPSGDIFIGETPLIGDIMQPFIDFYDNNAVIVPEFVGTCPSISVFYKDIDLEDDTFCVLMDQNKSTISLIMMFVYSIIGFRITFSA